MVEKMSQNQRTGPQLQPKQGVSGAAGGAVCNTRQTSARAQAWGNGLRNYLSDVPALFGAGQQGLNALERQAGGAVVVNEIGSQPLAQHGPAISFWPDVFVIGPSNVTRVAY